MMKVKKAVEKYLDESPRSYRFTLHQLIQFVPENVSEIKKEHWECFSDFLFSKYKTNTVKDKLTKSKCFINFCQAEGWLKINKRRLRVPKPVSTRVVATYDEYKRMCAVLDEYRFHDLKKLLAIKFLALGLRIGEVRMLNREQVVSAKRFACPATGKISYFTTIISEKSHKERFVVWEEKMHFAILRYVGVLISINPNPELFCSSSEKRITTRSIERWFNEVKGLARIDRSITCHSLRHMKAHRMREQKADLKAIQLALGHTNPTSTLNYLNLDVDESISTLQKYLYI